MTPSRARVSLTRRAVAIGAAVVALAVPAVAAPAARAQAPRNADLELVSQDPWTPVGGELHTRLRTGSADDGLSISIVAYEAIASRSGFDDTTSDKSLGSVLGQLELPLAAVPADALGTRPLTIGLQAPGGARDATRLAVRRAGVYPLAFELRDRDDRTLSRFVTYLVVVAPGIGGEAIAERLGVAWVWPLTAPPSTLPDGSPDPKVLAQLQPSGRLGKQVQALASTDARLTLVPGAETLETWSVLARSDANAATSVSRLQGSLGHTQVLDAPYVPVNLPSLLAADMGGAADTEFVRGDDTLKQFFAGRVDSNTAHARPVDAASLARLRARGADRFVVESSALEPASSRFTPAAPFALEAPPSLVPGGLVPAVVGDEGLTRLLGGDDAPALRAQRFLAGLSVISQEQPNRARAVVVINPDDFDPPATLLDAVLAGLAAHPWLRSMTISDVFASVPAANDGDVTPTRRSLAPYGVPAPPVTAVAYNRTQLRLDGFRSLVGHEDERIASGERALLLCVAAPFEGGDRGRATLGSVDAAINDVIAKIQVPPRNTITLTARSGDIPLTFRNETGEPVHVLLKVASEKLFFPDGSTRTVMLPPRSTTVRVAVEARTSGSFPFRLVLSSADGQLPITDTQFRVRSTFVSTVGIALTVGAGVFLVLWWGWDFRRRRRRRRAAAPAAAR